MTRFASGLDKRRRPKPGRASVEDRKFEQFEAAEIEFDAGLKTSPDLVEDRLDYEQARIELIRVKYALLTERLNLLALTGQLGHDAGSETRGAESNS